MPKITISYRRADSDAIAGRIRDRLAGYYGEKSVFIDIDNIPFGIDFRDHIKDELAQTDILLAVVGPRWLGPGEGGHMRIKDETDPVRIEIEAALQRGIPVVPVLVHGATIPGTGELPDSIKSFAFHNAADVDAGRDFHPHMDRLIRSMDRVMRYKGKTAAPPRRKLILAGLAASVCAALLAGGVWYYLTKTVPKAQPRMAPPVVASAPPLEQPAPPQPAPVTPQLQPAPTPTPPAPPVPPVRVENPGWQAFPNIPATEFRATFDKMVKDGYRPKTISGYVAEGGEQYASLWIKAAGIEWQARFDLAALELRTTSDAFIAAGYRPVWLSAHEFNGEVHFAGIWEKPLGIEGRWRINLTVAQLQAQQAELEKEGYQLIHLYGYANAGVANFAAIFAKTGNPQAPFKFDLSPADFQKAFEEYAKRGFRPKAISGYRIGDQDFRAGVWERNEGLPWYSRTGLPLRVFANMHDSMMHQGYRPLTLTGFGGPVIRTATVWENVAIGPDARAIMLRMQQYIAAQQVAGVAIAITKDGRLVHAGGYGYADRASFLDAAPTSLFRIADISKAITAVAILKLVEANKLALDDKVFGPDSILGSRFPTPAFNKRIERITVRHLLQHVSGFGNAPNDPLATYSYLAPDAMIRTVVNDRARVLAREPGTQFEFSNFGYSVLGRVIEQVAGTGYEQYVKDNVLTPAGIGDMSIGGDLAREKKPREATYYPPEAYSQKPKNSDSTAGWIASPIDLARFLVHVDGSSTKPDVISAASHALMTASSGIKDANGRDPFSGFGWLVSPQAAIGAMPGSLAYAAVLPGGFTVAAITNTRPATDENGQILQSNLRDIIASVKAWPAYDLFNGPPP